MSEKRLCPGCMTYIEGEGPLCPHCGGELERQNPAPLLPVGAILTPPDHPVQGAGRWARCWGRGASAPPTWAGS